MESGDCGVCISVDFDECAFEFCNITVRQARKSHKCCECGDTIQSKQKYEHVAGKWDGNINTYRTCLSCVEIREALCCDGWVYGMLWESAEGQVFPYLTTGCLEKLTTSAAKQKLVDAWNRWKFEDSQ